MDAFKEQIAIAVEESVSRRIRVGIIKQYSSLVSSTINVLYSLIYLITSTVHVLFFFRFNPFTLVLCLNEHGVIVYLVVVNPYSSLKFSVHNSIHHVFLSIIDWLKNTSSLLQSKCSTRNLLYLQVNS